MGTHRIAEKQNNFVFISTVQNGLNAKTKTMEVFQQGSTEVKLDDTSLFSSISFQTSTLTKLGTCMPPSADVGSVLAISKFIAAYGVRGGNCRVMLVKEGTATAILNGHSNNIVDTAICSDEKPTGNSILATLSGDGVCRLWEISNQESGSELEAREILCLRTKTGQAQRVLFHPQYISKVPMVFVLHGNTVSGVLNNKDVKEYMASESGLFLEEYASLRFTFGSSQVLDLCFQEEARGFLAATGHEDGSACVWNMELQKESPPLHVLKVGESPVLSVNFVSSSALLVGSDRNTKVCLWNLESLTVQQTVFLSRNVPAIRNFRTSFVKRISDGACCLVLFESRSKDCVVLQILRNTISKALCLRVKYPVLSVTGCHDAERDILFFHAVDVDSIGDLFLEGSLVFGTTRVVEPPKPPRQSVALLRRLSKRNSKNSLTAVSAISDKESSCCAIS